MSITQRFYYVKPKSAFLGKKLVFGSGVYAENGAKQRR